jgi:colanic acid biosynthesis glycosyl transferase WcaI
MILERAGSVVFLNRSYWPERPSGQMLNDLTEDLVRRGWDVTVITSRTPYGAGPGRLARREKRNGVRIVRVTADAFGRGRSVGRALRYLQYLVGVLRALSRHPEPDVVVAMSDPPLVLLPALLLARVRRARTVCWVRNVAHHEAAAFGLEREGSVIHRGFEALARLAHRRCDVLVSSGERIADELLAAGAPSDRVLCIHNWADSRRIWPVRPDSNPFRAEQGLNGAFVVLYSGRAGPEHRFSEVMEAAWQLREQQDIRFLFIGGGEQWPYLEADAWRLGLENVRFMDYQPRERLTYSLSAADVSLVSENPGLAGRGVPSKTFGILASGRPLLFVGSERSEVARIVSEHECGLVVPPGEADALVDALLSLKDNPQEAAAMGARAREAAVTLYDRRIATYRWHDVLQRVMNGAAPVHRSTVAATRPQRQPQAARPRPVLINRTSAWSDSKTS